jgi:hypothetical protein
VSLPTAQGTIVILLVNGGAVGANLATGTSELFIAANTIGGASSQGIVRIQGSAGHAGHRVSGTVAVSGRGGDGPWGGGGAAIKAQGTGGAGGNYGAGGGGGMSVNAGGAGPGGAGANGVVIVSEFY